MSAPKVGTCNVCGYLVVGVEVSWTFYPDTGEPFDPKWHVCHVCAATGLVQDLSASLNAGNGRTEALRARIQAAWSTNHVLATMAQMVAGLTGGTR